MKTNREKYKAQLRAEENYSEEVADAIEQYKDCLISAKERTKLIATATLKRNDFIRRNVFNPYAQSNRKKLTPDQ